MPPGPRKGETQAKFIGRCTSYLVEEEGRNQKQALAICYGMWRKQHGESETMSDNTLMDALTKYFGWED